MLNIKRSEPYKISIPLLLIYTIRSEDFHKFFLGVVYIFFTTSCSIAPPLPEIDEEKVREFELQHTAPYDFLESAYNGNSEAAFNLAAYYYEEFKNDQATLKWLVIAASKGHTVSLNELGSAYYYGYYGLPVDYKSAFYWLNRAYKQGDEIAPHIIGLMYQKGQGVRKNIKKSTRYYKLSADRGYDLGMFTYGMHLYEGIGIEKNTDLAEKYFQNSIKAGLRLDDLILSICNKELENNSPCQVIEAAIKSRTNKDPREWLERLYNLARLLQTVKNVDNIVHDFLISMTDDTRDKLLIGLLYPKSKDTLTDPKFISKIFELCSDLGHP